MFVECILYHVGTVKYCIYPNAITRKHAYDIVVLNEEVGSIFSAFTSPYKPLRVL